VEFSGKIRTGDSNETINIQRATNRKDIERRKRKVKADVCRAESGLQIVE